MPCHAAKKDNNNCGQHLSSSSCVSGLVVGSASPIPVLPVEREGFSKASIMKIGKLRLKDSAWHPKVTQPI